MNLEKMASIQGSGPNSGHDYCINMAATASGAIERGDVHLAFTVGYWMGKMGC